jgi:hypothetical protein
MEASVLISERRLRKVVAAALQESFGRQTWESMAQLAGVEPERARAAVEKFRELRDKGRITTHNLGQGSDITHWLRRIKLEGPAAFDKLEQILRGYDWKKFKRPSALKDWDVIDLGTVAAKDGSGQKFNVRIPLSEEKSCVIGHGTKQCIAATEGDNAFFKYFVWSGWTIFFVQRMGSGPKPREEHQNLMKQYGDDRAAAIRNTYSYTILLHEADGSAEIWTAENFLIRPKEFEESTGVPIYWFEDKLSNPDIARRVADARHFMREEYGLDEENEEDDYYR